MLIIRKLYKAKTVKFIRHLILLKVLLCLLIVIVLLPYQFSLALGRILGWLACWIAKNYRIMVEKNLKLAFGKYSYNEIRKIRNKTFKNIGMNLVEFGLLSFRSKKFWFKRIDITGRHILEKHLDNKQGVILLSAHVGNWELMGAYLAMIGYPINVVAREIYDKRLDRLLVAMRNRRGVNIIYREGRVNTKKMISVLKKGEVLGILMDQDTRVGGIFVDFFGRPAYTPTAVSQFARIKNTVVVPGFVYRKKNLRHQVVIMEQCSGGVNEEKETREYTKIIEDFIRKYPEQWVWMHPRWKRRPEELKRK